MSCCKGTREFLAVDEQSNPLYIMGIESELGLDSFMKYFRSLMILVGSDGLEKVVRVRTSEKIRWCENFRWV